ncbi:2Fe-2S iron-sulfur cluster-binding protein [Streptomyces sp. NPDC058299]|uniref:2Fe-2S iron-sulfur cluster-binding protein n=1 Tax=Streptomyces sp. NPDC058299 TaxID=3346435 RepID=UPI0036E5E8DA
MNTIDTSHTAVPLSGAASAAAEDTPGASTEPGTVSVADVPAAPGTASAEPGAVPAAPSAASAAGVSATAGVPAAPRPASAEPGTLPAEPGTLPAEPSATPAEPRPASAEGAVPSAVAPPVASGPQPSGRTRRSGWYPLVVAEVGHLPGDAVAVTLEVPGPLREVFAHRPGEHVVVRHRLAGRELRRSYSVCPPPDAPAALRLVIRRGAPDGFGAHAATALAPGDVLELSPPTGTFALPGPPGGHHVLIAGGSGITPLAAMAATALREDPACRVSLIHSVPTSADALLADELALLKDAFVDRFTVLYVLTREERGAGLPGGRVDGVTLPRLLTAVGALPGPGTAFALCGPAGLVVSVRRALTAWGAEAARIRSEMFTSAGTGTPRPSAPPRRPTAAPQQTRVTALLSGHRRLATAGPGDATLLDALLRAHPDVPYACREGVCGTCRARVLSGRVTAAPQHALDAEETAAGYTLVCRARPLGTELTLDFDA